MIARSLPGDIKEMGLGVLVAIGVGMFLTQVVETGLTALERTVGGLKDPRDIVV